MTVSVFNDDETGYLTWVSENALGFVVNTRTNLDPDYLVLHRASCSSVRKYPLMDQRPGGFTERAYQKICSRSEQDLANYLSILTGKPNAFSKTCSRCYK